jgi:hypothetical protein
VSDILAIVGSTTFTNPNWRQIALREMRAEVERYDQAPERVISGGADGIDKLAEEYARYAGIPFEEFLPRYRRWEPFGFKVRNTLIGNACTRLLAIRCIESQTYGSGWTADYAEKVLRKPVRRVIVERSG